MSSSDEFRENQTAPLTMIQFERNVLASISDLSNELEFLGFSALPSFNVDNTNLDRNTLIILLTSLIKVTWRLARRLQTNVTVHQERESKHCRVADDNSSLKAQVQLLKSDISKKDEQLFTSDSKHKELKIKFDKVQRDLKHEKEEVLRLKSKLMHQDSQYSHLVRRRDQEIIELQDQLRQTMGLGVPRGLRKPQLLPVISSLVLTDSFEKLTDKIMYPYADPHDLQKHVFSRCHF